jgi:dihydroorotase-like cyclic amidohydrolase
VADRAWLDVLIENVRLVRPGPHAIETRDLGITDGRFIRVEPVIDAARAREVFDARRGMACSHSPGILRSASDSSLRAMSPPATTPTSRLLDPSRRFTVRAAELPSGQGYTPFEGQDLTERVTATFLRGARLRRGARGERRGGVYVPRPESTPAAAP